MSFDFTCKEEPYLDGKRIVGKSPIILRNCIVCGSELAPAEIKTEKLIWRPWWDSGPDEYSREDLYKRECEISYGTCAIDRAKSNKQFFTRSLITFSLIFLSIISISLEHFVLFFIFLFSSVISSCVLFLSQTTISTNKYDETSKTFWILGFGDGLLNQYSVNGKIQNTWIMISLFDKEANAKKEKGT